MSRNLYCEQCGEEATVFALQPPLKIKACPQHAHDLIKKYPSIFNIDAFNFIEAPEDYSGYVVKRDIAQKCQGSLTVLQERCETNQLEAHSHLQTAKESIHTVVERGIEELQTQVEQRYQQIKEELNSLSANLDKFVSDKHSSLTPTFEALSKSTPTGALFRVCGGDCSLEIIKTVLKSWVLLPSDEGMPQIDTGEKLLAKAKTKQADLAEEIYTYALELGFPGPNCDFKTAADKLRESGAKKLLLALPWTATEPQVRAVVEQYLQRGRQVREEGDYAKSLKKLERGWELLQQWGVESAEMCLQLGVIWIHFGRAEEAVAILKQGLQLSSSSDLSLKLYRNLVEVYFQRAEGKEVVEVGELALASVDSQFDVFELLQLLYFLTYSHYVLGNESQGFALLTHWTSRCVVDSVQSQFALQCIYAEKKNREGSAEVVERYEAALQTSGVQTTYLAVFSHYTLGVMNAALHRPERAIHAYLQALPLFSVHFPCSINYATGLAHLAEL